MSDTQPALPPLPNELLVFAKDVGTWDAIIETRPAPGTAPTTTRGVATNRLAAGGRWLLMDFTTETGFEGHGVYGFDPAKARYVGTWVDPFRTSLAPMEGTWDPAARTMTFVGEMARPDGTLLRWRETTETVDDRTQIFRTFMPAPDGADVEVFKATYRRR